MRRDDNGDDHSTAKNLTTDCVVEGIEFFSSWSNRFNRNTVHQKRRNDRMMNFFPFLGQTGNVRERNTSHANGDRVKRILMQCGLFQGHFV